MKKPAAIDFMSIFLNKICKFLLFADFVIIQVDIFVLKKLLKT